MGIPLFQGRAGSLPDIAPITPDVEALLSSPQRGANLAATQQDTLQRQEEFPFRLAGIAADTRYRQTLANKEEQLLPYEIEQEKASASLLPLQVEHLKAQSSYQNALAQVEVGKVKLQADQAQRKAGITQIFDDINQGADLSASLGALEKNFPDFLSAAVTQAPNGKTLADPELAAEIYRLPSLATDPQTKARADNLVSSYRQILNDTSQLGSTKGLEGQQSAPAANIDPTTASDFLLGNGELPTQQPRTAVQNTFGGPIREQQPQVQAQNQAQAQGPETGNAAPTGFPFTQKPTGDEVSPGEVNKPTSQRLVTSDAPKSWLEKQKRLTAINIAQGMTPDQADARAIEALSKSNWTKSQEDYDSAITKGAALFDEIHTRAKTATDRLIQLYEGHPKLAPLGKTQSIGQIKQALYDNIKPENPERPVLDDIFTELNALGNLYTVATISDVGGTSRTFDSDNEKKMFAPLSFTDQESWGLIRQATELSGAKAEQLKNRAIIMHKGRFRGIGFGDIKAVQEDYVLDNPAAIPGVAEDGQPYAVKNPNMQSAAAFLKDIFPESRTPGGRNIAAPPVTPSSAASKISFDSNAIPDALSIPSHLPNGASEGLVKRVIAAESSGNPNATNKESSAKGLMALTDATGKEQWRDLGLPGGYDPFNRKFNVMMGTNYLNKQLAYFGGDTRLALAAYHEGPNAVYNARDKAEEHLGDTSWEAVKHYLPQTKTDKQGKTIPNPVFDYVEKIMGDKPGLEGVKTYNDQELHSIFASIPSQKGQQNARAILSPQGIEALGKSAKIKSPDQLGDSPLKTVYDLLTSANPIGATEAQAQEPGGQATPDVEGKTKGTQLVPNDTVAGQLAAKLPPFLQEWGMGAARTMLFGLDDEAAAQFRMAALHEDHDVALENARAIKEQVASSNSWAYLAGELTGGLLNPVVRAAGAAGKLIGGALEGATEAAPVAERAADAASGVVGPVIKGALRGGLKGAAQGAGYGAAQGFDEGEGGAANRVANAGLEAVVGATGGLVLGGLVGAGGELLKSSTVRGFVQKIKDYATGDVRTPVHFTDSEQYLVDRLENLPDEDWAGAVARLKATDNKAAALINEIGEGNLKQIVRSIGRDPDSSAIAQRAAGGVLDERNQRVSDYIKPKKTPEQAFTDLAKSARSKAAQLEAERVNAAEAAYGAARESLPGGVFKSDEVKQVIEDYPTVAKAVSAAQSKFKAGTPAEDFDVLRTAKSELQNEVNDGSGAANFQDREALSKFKKALYAESDAYKQADAKYLEGSTSVDEFKSNPIFEISSKLEQGKIKDINDFGNKLFSYDAGKIEQMKNSLDAEGQENLKEAARGHVMNQLLDQGKREKGKPQTFPSFAKDKFPEKLKAILGNDEGSALAERLREERGISDSVNAVLTEGSQTEPNLKEKQSVTKFVKQAASAATRLVVFKGRGLPGAVPSIGNILEAVESDPATKKLSKDIMDIVLFNKEKGINFAEKVRTHLANKEHSEEFTQAWDKLFDYISSKKNEIAYGSLASAGAQTAASRPTTFKPETRKMKK